MSETIIHEKPSQETSPIRELLICVNYRNNFTAIKNPIIRTCSECRSMGKCWYVGTVDNATCLNCIKQHYAIIIHFQGSGKFTYLKC